MVELIARPTGFALIDRSAALRGVEHHFIFDHDAASPHRRFEADRIILRPVRPIVEAAADRTLIIPGDDLRLFRLPAPEQPGLGHDVQQPDRAVDFV